MHWFLRSIDLVLEAGWADLLLLIELFLGVGLGNRVLACTGFYREL